MAFGAAPVSIRDGIANPRCPGRSQAAFSTLFDRRQRVHTRMDFTVPSRFARTRCRFGFQRRLVLLLAWLTLLPTEGPLPQTLQILAIVVCSQGTVIPNGYHRPRCRATRAVPENPTPA